MIRTTHTGSLPRPDDLLPLLQQADEGRLADRAAFEARVRRAVEEIVQKQRALGIDIVNDGEQGKIDYSTYIKDRLRGFEGEGAAPPLGADLKEFPEFAARRPTAASTKRPTCSGPIAWKDWNAVEREIQTLKRASEASGSGEVFMTSVSPGQAARFLLNRYYPTHEAYVAALADVLKREYAAIVDAGFVLQIDCPDLASGRNNQFQDLTLEQFRRVVAGHIEALNHAVAGLPPERMRLHVCWGNYEGPHHRDVPLRDIVDLLLTARPAGLSVEGANPRHAHEWAVFEEVKLPEERAGLGPQGRVRAVRAAALRRQLAEPHRLGAFGGVDRTGRLGKRVVLEDIRCIKERAKAVEVILADRIKLVVVALGTTDLQPQ